MYIQYCCIVDVGPTGSVGCVAHGFQVRPGFDSSASASVLN